MAMLQYVLPALLALVGGLAGSLLAPIVQWSIEKRRGKAAYRREMITRWREAVSMHDFHKRWEKAEHPFGGTPEYAEMRQYLDPEFCKAFERGRTLFAGATGRGADGARTRILDAIAELERKWDLL